MEKSPAEKLHTKVNAILAVSVALAAFVTYCFLVAPTVCFWDCGEYVAAGYSLGIPHPPGNPLFVLLCRTFSIVLFFLQDVGLRMNLLASLSGAIAAMLIYLIIVRVFTGWITKTPDTNEKRAIVYISAVAGALLYAYSNSIIFSSVESEVNVPQLVPIMLGTWLTLVWAQSKDPGRDRILLLISYISFLGIGLHMYSMITLLPALVFVMLTDKTKRTDWRLWGTALVSGLVIYSISWFIWLGLGLAVATLLFSFAKTQKSSKWRFCFWIVFLALLGFSVHTYVPIRSSLGPMIDENHPATWSAFTSYLERKQYGSESMISRMFWRRGTFAHQFGIEGHMGFGGFFITQFFRISETDTERSLFAGGAGRGWLSLFIYLIPTFLMFWSWRALAKKYLHVAVMLILLEVICTVGLVMYMNFADGTRPERREYLSWVHAGKPGQMPVEHREVRVRDYFFIGGFAFHALWMGIAFGLMMHGMYTSRRRWVRTTLAPISTVLIAISPLLPLSQNAARNNRHGDWLPYDFAYNMLMSCKKDGILVTNGDNDTFPLWALQEAYGIRRDVRIVNLSLLNTDWYIKQMRDYEPRVPVSMSDEQIEKLNAVLNPFEEPSPYDLPGAGISVTVPPRSRRNAILVQDKMLYNIVNANRWRKPVYFATTVSQDNFMGFDPYLQFEGLAYSLRNSKVPGDSMINVEKSSQFLDNVYRFRGLGSQRANYDETQLSMLSNYAACFIQRALAQRSEINSLKMQVADLEKNIADSTKAQDSVSAAVAAARTAYEQKIASVAGGLQKGIALIPWDWRMRLLTHEVYVSNAKFDEAEKNAQEGLAIDPGNNRYIQMLEEIVRMRKTGG